MIRNWIGEVPLREIPGRNSLGFEVEGGQQISIEELVAVLLEKAARLAGSDVKQAVITVRSSRDDDDDQLLQVPPFFTAEQRSLVREAADLAGLRVLAVVDDISAGNITRILLDTAVVVMTYLMDYQEVKQEKHVIFVDSGASCTRISLVQMAKKEGKGTGILSNQSQVTSSFEQSVICRLGF